MATRKVKIKVGVFLLVCFAIMAGAVIYLMGFYKDSGAPYSMEFEESVLGVYEGSIVEYLGLPVGKVVNMEVTPTKKAHIDILLDPEKVTLHRGVEAQLVLYSLATGAMAVELRGGDPQNGVLPPHSEIPTKPSALAAISTEGENIVASVSTIISKIEKGLNGIEEGDLSNFLHRVQAVVEEIETLALDAQEALKAGKEAIATLEGRIDPLADEVLALGENIRRTSDDASEFLTAATEKTAQLDVAGMSDKLGTVLEEVSELTAQLKESAANLDASSATILHEADNLEYSVRAALQDASATMVTLESLLVQLKQDPSSLLRGRGKVEE